MLRRFLAVALGFIVILAGSAEMAPPAQAALRTRTFQTPSGNIGCGFYQGFQRCDILSGLNPEPEGDCEGDWTGLGVESGGTAAPVCAGDTVYDPNAPVLEYGKRWKRRGIVCVSRRKGLRCRNQLDHGFFLSRDSWRTF